jgi:hypothetical protein
MEKVIGYFAIPKKSFGELNKLLGEYIHDLRAQTVLTDHCLSVVLKVARRQHDRSNIREQHQKTRE